MTTETTASSAPATAATADNAPAVQQPASGTQPPSAPAVQTAIESQPAKVETGGDAELGADAKFGKVTGYEKTGNDSLDLALGFVGKHGLTPEHPAMVAATKGDFTALEALFSEAQIPGWEAHLALAKTGYKEHVAAEKAKADEISHICVTAAGDDPEQWGAALQWARGAAEPAEIEVINKMLAEGGMAATLAATGLMHLYRSNPANTVPAKSAVKPNASSSASQGTAPLSPKEYGAAVQDLRRTLGPKFENSREYQQLQARRAAYR